MQLRTKYSKKRHQRVIDRVNLLLWKEQNNKINPDERVELGKIKGQLSIFEILDKKRKQVKPVVVIWRRGMIV